MRLTQHGGARARATRVGRWCCGGLVVVSLSGQAAPGDAWLSAEPLPHRAHIELMSDMVNDTVDVLKLRENDSRYAGTSTGDYAGGHVHGAWQITPKWEVEGSFWRRRVDFRGDAVRFESWHVASQYQWRSQSGGWPSSALRLSQWGSSASAIRRTTPATLNGTTLESFEVADPRDSQIQGDWIASWSLAPSTLLNVWGGGGRSEVSVGAISATTRDGGCLYNLNLSQGRAQGQLAGPCGDLLDASFNIPISAFPINPEAQSRYKSTFAQAGFNLGWRQGDWGARAGYLVRQFRREGVDDALAAQGVTPIKSVQVVSSELRYRLSTHVAAVARAELTSSQLMADVPSIYNGLTASRMGQRYGLVSLGLVVVLP